MADITEDDIRQAIVAKLPVGDGGIQFTLDNLYRVSETRSMDSKGNEGFSVSVEFQAKEKQEFEGDTDDLEEERINAAITNQYQPEHQAAITALEEIMEEVRAELWDAGECHLRTNDMVCNQWGRLMWKFEY